MLEGCVNVSVTRWGVTCSLIQCYYGNCTFTHNREITSVEATLYCFEMTINGGRFTILKISFCNLKKMPIMQNRQWNNTDLRTCMAHKCVGGESHHPDIRQYLPHNTSSIENSPCWYMNEWMRECYNHGFKKHVDVNSGNNNPRVWTPQSRWPRPSRLNQTREGNPACKERRPTSWVRDHSVLWVKHASHSHRVMKITRSQTICIVLSRLFTILLPVWTIVVCMYINIKARTLPCNTWCFVCCGYDSMGHV